MIFSEKRNNINYEEAILKYKVKFLKEMVGLRRVNRFQGPPNEKATPFFSTLDSAPRAYKRALQGSFVSGSLLTLSAPILSKRHMLSELQSFSEIFSFLVPGEE